MKKGFKIAMLLASTGAALNGGSEIDLIEKACKGGYAAKCYDLGQIYQKGRIVEQDIEKAKVFFKKACEDGYRKGCTASTKEASSEADHCSQKEFEHAVQNLNTGKIESTRSLKETYRKLASKQSPQCRSQLFGDFIKYYHNTTQTTINSLEKSLNEHYPLSAQKEKEYKTALQKIGLRIDQGEGMYYIEPDNDWLLSEFGNTLPDAWKQYLKQSSHEARNHFAEDGALQVPFEALRKRIIFWERFLKKYSNFPENDQIKEQLSGYLYFYLSDLKNTLNFALIPISIDSIKESYENFIKENNDSKYYKTVKSHYAILKESGFKVNKGANKRLSEDYKRLIGKL